MIHLLFLFVVIPGQASPAEAAFSGMIAEVESAEVLVIQQAQQQQRVRLYGVDCPEEGQPFFAEARQFVEAQVKGLTVQAAALTQDDSGLPVVTLTLPDGSLLGERLIGEGLAWWDFQNTPDDVALKRLNARALLAKVGLWAEATPLAPWDYRHSHGLKDFAYEVAKPEPLPAPAAAAAPEVPTFKKKGTYTGVSTVTPEMIRQVDALDPLALVTRHRPMMARDANGQVLGLTASDIGSIPLASALGFQEGDILSSVNGVHLQSEAQILTLITQFQDTKHFEVGLLRNGQPATITINLP